MGLTQGKFFPINCTQKWIRFRCLSLNLKIENLCWILYDFWYSLTVKRRAVYDQFGEEGLKGGIPNSEDGE